MSESNLELCYISATEAIKKFKEKTLSPVELVSEIIKRSEEINQKLNVFNFTCFEDALEKDEPEEVASETSEEDEWEEAFEDQEVD